MSARLREVVDEHIPDFRKALLVISSEDITYKEFVFPFDSSKKVIEAIQFETSADFPLSHYTVSPIETIPGEPGKKSFLVAIMHRETLRNRIREAESAGLKVIGITTDVSTLGYYFTEENESLIMEAGQKQTLFALYSHRIPILVRTIPIGLRSLRNEEQELKPEDVKPLASEIKRTILSFVTRSKLDLDKIYLAGPLLEGMRLSGALEQIKDFQFVERPPSFDFTLQAQEANPNTYASVLGAVSWRKRAKFFDFYKEEFAGSDSAVAGATYLRWGVLLLASFSCVLLLSSWLEIFVLQKRELFLTTSTRRVFSTVFPQVTKIVDEVRQARNMLETLRVESGGGGNPVSSASILDVLDRVSRTIPKEVPFQVSNVFWERGRLEIDGRTDSFKSVNLIQELLSKSPDFPEVTISNAKTKSDGQDVDFKITIRFAG